MIVVHAGHRMDAPDRTPARFPQDRVAEVRRRLGDLMDVLQPDGVVAAAAGGADLLIAEAALDSGIPLHVVLPFDRQRFKDESVADQGPPWTGAYDGVIDRVTTDAQCSLTELALDADEDGYRAGNQALIDRAVELGHGRVLAVTVRHHDPAEKPSITDDFVDRARAARLFVVEIDPLAGD